MSQLLTVKQVAEMLHVSNQNVGRLIKSGALNAIKVGKQYRVKKEDLEDFLRSSSIKKKSNSEGEQS